MDTRPQDTSPEAWAYTLALHRALSPARRVELALEMSDEVRAIQLEGLLARNPRWTRADAVRHLVHREFGVRLPDR
ncbi:MAG: hypothetical protein R3E98_07490 [Gemmatimonadota bacterium]